MTSRHPTIGGRGPAAKDGPPKLTKAKAAKPALALVPCDCGRKVKTLLQVGGNDITVVCECGATINVVAFYNGNGMALIHHGTLEKVVPE